MADTRTGTTHNPRYHRIFVSLDGSDTQEHVLSRAVAMAEADDADLYIGHVIDSSVMEHQGILPADALERMEQTFRDSIEAPLAEARSNTSIPRIEVLVRAGRIRETLMDEMINVIEPDLIICGARGLSTIRYALLGSISTFLARTAECDTLIIK